MADEKIKVLIVDDIAETRENIRKLLQFESDVVVVGTARTGQEAIDLSTDLEPHVVLMDINMPDMDGILATELIRQKAPSVQIVILSVQGDPNYMRRAMLAGARDFLTKPPTIDELISAIRRAGVMSLEERAKVDARTATVDATGGSASGAGRPGVDGRVIVVYSPKGGTGCTMLAANLAVSLQSDDCQVLVVDGNLQFGNVSIFFNESSKNHIGDLAPRVNELDQDVVAEVLIEHVESGVKILAAPPRPEFAEEITGEQFQQLLRYMRGQFDYVIVDATSALTEYTLAALDAADLVLLVSTQDIPSIAGTKMFLDLAQALGIPSPNLVFVMNRYDKRINITPERIGESFKKKIDVVVPLDSRTVIPSVNRGIPFMIDSKINALPIGRALQALAELVIEKAP
ncbi:MAG TPA: response regulator [Anaerolineales bacterium]|nr:response regulator [Anaerolineales bacterium]